MVQFDVADCYTMATDNCDDCTAFSVLIWYSWSGVNISPVHVISISYVSWRLSETTGCIR